MQLKDSNTYINLAKAYAGECMALTRYKFVSYGAQTEGYKAMSNLINDVIYNEFQHARMLYTFIQSADKGTINNIDIHSGFPFKEKWNLLDNLKFAADDEEAEVEVYGSFAKVAHDEGFRDIAGLFENMQQVESCHQKLFTQLYNQLKNDTMYKSDTPVKWKCGDCGYESTSKEAWQQCPLCQAVQGAVLINIED
ncbi:MAG: rubrerythrin family protein [Clostridia bacterium]|nr:rubrerythrin family protein [Clostridia bacterium]